MLTLHCIKYNLFLKNKTKVNNRLYHYELFFFLLTSITRRVKFLRMIARKRPCIQVPAPFLPGAWNLSTSMDSGVWPTVYGIMPKAKQTSINIFLRNPVPIRWLWRRESKPRAWGTSWCHSKRECRCSTGQKKKDQTIIQKRVARTIQMAKITALQ